MAESMKLREEQAVNSSNENSGATGATCEQGTNNPETSTSEPEFKVPELADIVLQRLARQVEYYFSTSNLAKDTYVCTLRSLNDGYVPVSIIANFGKVKALVPYDAINAVMKAAVDFSELLEVVRIDSQTGKRVTSDKVADDSSPLIEAVGPISGEPIPLSQIPAAPKSPSVTKPVSSFQNTVIIREVPEGTEESHVRDLFTFEKCPAISSIHLDVANCWFVSLDTESRDDMLNVMFELRTMKFPSGEPVKARVKSGVVVNSDLSSNAYVPDVNQMMYPPQSSSSGRYFGAGGRKNKKKKSGNKSRSNSGSNPGKNTKGKNGTSGTRRGNGGKPKKLNAPDRSMQTKQDGRLSQDGSKEKSPSQQAPPPALGEEQFPALASDENVVTSTKIEVEKVPEQRPEDDSSVDELEKNRTGSDSASTATTTSSSSSAKPQQQAMGGYAAALLKAAPPKPQNSEKDVKNSKIQEKGEKKVKTNINSKKKVEEVKDVVQAVPVSKPSWGGGRSFADVLRKEAEADVGAQAS